MQLRSRLSGTDVSKNEHKHRGLYWVQLLPGCKASRDKTCYSEYDFILLV